MVNSRSTHYWLWFLLFGLVAGFAQKEGFDSEAIVMSAVGAVGLLLGFSGGLRFARPFDLVVGLVFAGLGLLGILTSLGNLGHNLGLSASGYILGLKMTVPYCLIHTVLGLTSLNHGFKTAVAPTTVAVATPSQASMS